MVCNTIFTDIFDGEQLTWIVFSVPKTTKKREGDEEEKG